MPDFSLGDLHVISGFIYAFINSSVLGALNEENAWGISRFSDQQYLIQRREIEMQLRKQFIEIGGRPALENPIYFFLGRNHRFEENKRNVGYMIFLRDLDPDIISFSYGDSMFCFHDDLRPNLGPRGL